MYDAEFHEHHYKLVGCIDDSKELEVQQKIFYDHDRRMMDFFMWITNLCSCEKIVTSVAKSAEKMIPIRLYNHRLQLITFRARIIDEAIQKSIGDTVDSGILELTLEQVNKL